MSKTYHANSIKIDNERCKGCEFCCMVCPKQLLSLVEEYNSKGHHYVTIANPSECTGCRFCAIMCPEIAIQINIGE